MSVTSWWIAFQRHRGRIWQVLALVLTFAAGWQVGKIMSPYYASHPIVFTQGPPAASPSPQDSAQALNVLLEESRALQADAKVSATPALAEGEARPTGRPTIAAATDTQGKQFVGSVNSDLYHDPSCPSASRIKPANQVWFATKEEAEAAGYSPSQCTKEKLGLP